MNPDDSEICLKNEETVNERCENQIVSNLTYCENDCTENVYQNKTSPKIIPTSKKKKKAAKTQLVKNSSEASTFSKDQHFMKSIPNSNGTESYPQKSRDSASVYWNSSIKEVAASLKYVDNYDRTARKEKELKKKENTKQDIQYPKEKRLLTQSRNHFEMQYKEPYQDSMSLEVLPHYQPTEKTKKKRKQTKEMQLLKISTTAQGRVVEFAKNENPIQKNLEKTSNTSNFSNGRFDDTDVSHTDRDRNSKSHQLSLIASASYPRKQEAFVRGTNPNGLMHKYNHNSSKQKIRDYTTHQNRQSFLNEKGDYQQTPQVMELPMKNQSQRDLTNAFQNMVLVPSQSDNTPLINLIAEVSKQQKQQETLLREIEARLVNQEAQEFSARNYSQVAGQHAFSSEYLTVPQHVNLINPHLKGVPHPVPTHVGLPYPCVTDPSPSSTNRFRSYVPSYDSRMDFNGVETAYGSASRTSSSLQSFPCTHEQTTVLNNGSPHYEYSSGIFPSGPESVYHEWGSAGPVCSSSSSRYYDEFCTRQRSHK